MPMACHGPARISSPTPSAGLFPTPSPQGKMPPSRGAKTGTDSSQGSQANLTCPGQLRTLRSNNAPLSTMPGGTRSTLASGNQGSDHSTLAPNEPADQNDRPPPTKQSRRTQVPTRLETANAVPEKLENDEKYSVPGCFTLRPERHDNSSKS